MNAKDLEDCMREGALPSGFCVNYEWRWTLGGKSVTKAVKTLLRKGKAKATFYRDGANLYLLDTNNTQKGGQMTATELSTVTPDLMSDEEFRENLWDDSFDRLFNIATESEDAK